MRILGHEISLETLSRWQAIKFHANGKLGFYTLRLQMDPNVMDGIINYLDEDMGKGYPW